MRRRDFFGLTIGSFAFVSPRLTLAQQSGKLPIIGFLGGATPTMWAAWSGAFVDCLKALGWIDGQTAKLEFRWAEGRPELYTQFAQEFAKLNANVVVTSGAAVPALMKATSTTPIVFAVANDPVGAGMVKSLAQPGGNVTGSPFKLSISQTSGLNCRVRLASWYEAVVRRDDVDQTASTGTFVRRFRCRNKFPLRE